MAHHPKVAAFAVSQMIAANETLEDAGLGFTEGSALLMICGLTMHPSNPMLPNVTDMATALRKTPSGASRVLSGLIKSGYIQSDREIRGARSGAFSLTSKGKAFIRRLLVDGAYVDLEYDDLELYSVESYAKAKYIDRVNNSYFNILQYLEDSHTIFIRPLASFILREMEDWCKSNLDRTVEFFHQGDLYQIKFYSKVDLIFFQLKWAKYRQVKPVQ